jgi:hypothetical protein
MPAMESKTPPTSSVAHKVAHELLEYALISAYLYVCFGALLLYKTAVLRGEHVSYIPYGTAAINALVLGKFILLGQVAGLGDRYGSRRTVYVIVHKALLFLAMLLVLSAVEEIVVGLIHGRTVAASLADFLGGSLLQVLATSAIMLLILIPYLTFKELGEALGEGRLRQILLERHAGPRHGVRPAPDQVDQISSSGPTSRDGGRVN